MVSEPSRLTPFDPMASSSNDSPIPTFSLPNITHFIQTKLDSSSDYLILKTHDLLGIVDGSEPCPPQFIPVTDETGKVTDQLNPKYTLWQKKDQFLLSWINTTLSANVLSSVYGLDTFRQVWDSLATRFASHSRSIIFYSKKQLQTL